MKYLIPFLFIILPTLSIAQNIGVGTIEPKAKLHVAGQILTDSSLVLDTISIGAAAFIDVPKEAGFVIITNEFGKQDNQMMMNGNSKPGQLLFVHNQDDDSVFFHEKIITPRSTSLFINEGMSWLQITDKNASNILSDANGDTRVLVEKRPNEDKIRFEIGGDSVLTIEKNRRGKPKISFGFYPVVIGSFSGDSLQNASQTTVVGNYALSKFENGSNTAIGYGSLKNLSSGHNNTSFGVNTGYELNGYRNTLIGDYTGYDIEGNDNIAIGFGALRQTRGSTNSSVFIGNNSGYRQYKSLRNVVIGDQANYISDSLYNSTILGFRAGHLAEGNHNIFIGDSAGINNSWTETGNVFIGRKSGADNTSGEFNTFLGNLSGSSSIGTGNSFFGYNAATELSGSYNTIFGYKAGSESDLVDNSVIIGSNAASKSDTIIASTVIGYFAGRNAKLRYNTIIGSHAGNTIQGERNTVVGGGAGYNGMNNPHTPSGNDNLILGHFSGRHAMDNSRNVVMGSLAASNKTPGDDNVIIGYKAGYAGNGASYSIFLGSNSGYASSGDYNQLIGYNSGFSNTLGENNTFLGYQSGYQNTTGSKNLFIGTQSGENNTTASSNIALGYRSAYSNETGGSNISIGTDALFRNLSGSRNIAIGDSAGFNNRSVVGKNIFIGHGAGKNELGKNKLIIENSSSSDALIVGDFKDDYLSFGGSLYSELIRPKVDISYSLGQSYYRYTAVYALNGTIQTSDIRQKKNIENLNYGLNEVMAMRSVSYEWKHDTIGETKVGFIAQELEQIVPEVVVVGDDSLQTRGVNYAELIPVLVKAIQEQQQIITDLEEENNSKTADLDAVNDRLSALEQKLNLLVGDLAKK
jgi:hypothetical protein